MKSFKYKIYNKDGILRLINYISRETKEEALRDLKEEFIDCDIKLTEVKPANSWSC